MSYTVQPIGFGTKLEYGDGSDYASSSTWTQITQVVEIEPLQYNVSKVKTTNLNQAAKAHTYQSGMKDPETAKVTIVFDKTMVNTIETSLLLKNLGWRITLADSPAALGTGTSTSGTTIGFSGFIAKKGEKTPMEEMDVYEFEIQGSGDSTLTPGA